MCQEDSRITNSLCLCEAALTEWSHLNPSNLWGRIPIPRNLHSSKLLCTCPENSEKCSVHIHRKLKSNSSLYTIVGQAKSIFWECAFWGISGKRLQFWWIFTECIWVNVNFSERGTPQSIVRAQGVAVASNPSSSQYYKNYVVVITPLYWAK